MRRTLEAFHRDIATGIDAIRGHCVCQTPDTVGLGSARLRLSRISAARSRFVAEAVIPRLLADADPALRSDLAALQRTFNARRLASSRHVTIWSAQAIQSDWDGYRRAARDIWAMMDDQIHRERTILGERLRRIDA